MHSSHLGYFHIFWRYLKKILKRKYLYIFLTLSILITLLVLADGGKSKISVTHSNSSANTENLDSANSSDNKIISPLTGMTLSDSSLVSRQVTAAMIDNSLAARPQSGLGQAGIIFTAMTEGGITRYMALYQEAQPSNIGPIRSARSYFLDYALPFSASLAHVGGSPGAQSDIISLGVRDLDQQKNEAAYSKTELNKAPSNVFTNFGLLDKLNSSKKYTESNFVGFAHKKDVPQSPTARTIDFLLSSQYYNSEFKYNSSTNSYWYSQGGVLQKDAINNSALSPKVVIALFVQKAYDPDGQHTSYETSGQGKLYVFQDGIVSVGNWKKQDRKSQLVFTDQYGLPMKLNAGQVWITLVSNDSNVLYKS
jgi:Protein of unknown function (DUF3048) N-terminal domain/Protein of unknown function (DUF3048) C-terminal domain